MMLEGTLVAMGGPAKPVKRRHAIVIGASVVLAAIDGTKDGKVRTVPATADTYFRVGVCEAAADDGSLALIRFAPKEIIVS